MTKRVCKIFEFEVFRRDFEPHSEFVVHFKSLDFAVLYAELALLGRDSTERLVFFDEVNRCTFSIAESDDGRTSILDYQDRSRLEVSVARKTLKRFWNLCLQSYEAGISPVGHFHLEPDGTQDEVTIWFSDFEVAG